jgi:hypothetical protein
MHEKYSVIKNMFPQTISLGVFYFRGLLLFINKKLRVKREISICFCGKMWNEEKFTYKYKNNLLKRLI